MPGESPNDAAQRRRERAERLVRIGALRPSAGSARATARALTGLPSGWTVLHDRVGPGRRGARIDHVVVGPGGVFVIATQSWAGTVSVEDGSALVNVVLQLGQKVVVAPAEAPGR